MDCVFCKIIKKEVPCKKIYEDSHCLAFLDINPCCKGHSVVIPKTHAELIFDLPDEISEKLMTAVKRVMQITNEKLKPDGFNVGWNSSKAGGQVVPHLHIHIFPRYSGDGGGSMHSIIKNPGQDTEEVYKLFDS